MEFGNVNYDGATSVQDIENAMHEEQEEIRVQRDMMEDVDSIIREMNINGGVNRELAVDLEKLSPGILTEHMPINSFTQFYSRTNLSLAMENAEKLKAGLMIGGGLLVAGIVGKIIHWIFTSFGDNDDKMSSAGAKHETAVVTNKKVDDIIDSVMAVFKGYPEEFKTAALNELPKHGFETNTVANATAAMNMLTEMGRGEPNINAKYTQYIYDTINDPAKHGKFVEALVAGLPHAMASIEKATETFIQLMKDTNTEIDPDKLVPDLHLNTGPLSEFPKLYAEKQTDFVQSLTKVNANLKDLPTLDKIGTADLMFDKFKTLNLQALRFDSIKKQQKEMEELAKKKTSVLEADRGLKDDFSGRKRSEVIKTASERLREAWKMVMAAFNIVRAVQHCTISFSDAYNGAVTARRNAIVHICRELLSNEKIDSNDKDRLKNAIITLEKK